MGSGNGISSQINFPDYAAAAGAAIASVIAERDRQDAKWGEQNHDAGRWALILLEELGEWAKAELDARPNESHKEAVHVTAVALAIVECMNRKRMREGKASHS